VRGALPAKPPHLLWVYYSSLILFFGAAVTKARTLASGKAVVPRAMAVRVQLAVVEERG
jgi:membrane protein